MRKVAINQSEWKRVIQSKILRESEIANTVQNFGGKSRRESEQAAAGFAPKELMRNLVAARAINWVHDPLAGGAYSYTTPETRTAQAVLLRSDGGVVFFSGEALYRGRDLGTVEAALASGLETARNILRG